LGLAGTDVVGETVTVVGVTHEDCGLDGCQGGAGQCGTCAAADGVVHDLTSLRAVSTWLSWISWHHPYLRVSDEDDLGVRALLVVGSNSLDNSRSSLGSRVVVGNASAGRSSTARWIYDGFGSCTGVGALDGVYEPSGGTVAIALRQGSLTSSEDVDLRAALALGELNWAGGRETCKESCRCSELHVDVWISGYFASDGDEMSRERDDQVWATGEVFIKTVSLGHSCCPLGRIDCLDCTP